MKNIWLFIIGLILIGCGGYVLFNPLTALVTSAIVAGVTFIMMGIGYLISFTRSQSYMHVALGILDIIVGLILLTNLGITTVSMPMIFAFWCLFVGITQLVAALEMRTVSNSIGNWLLASGIIGIVFALLIFFNPVFGILTISFLMGAYLILYGIFEIIRATRN